MAYPDTCVGTDSHTTMVNGLGVLGWGVGGIEAEAAMLGQPVSMLIPRVVGFKLTGEIQPGVTATDVVLTVTEMLRKHGVVGKFVEFYGQGVAEVPLANRATLGNMSPEFGSTAAIFPIDEVTIDYLRLTGRPEDQLELVEAYAKAQGMWHDPEREPVFSEYLELDLSDVVPSIAGPKRPQDRISLSEAKSAFRKDIHNYVEENSRSSTPSSMRPSKSPSRPAIAALSFADDGAVVGASAAEGSHGRPSKPAPVKSDERGEFIVDHGAVVVAAITSCTNTSNPRSDDRRGAAGEERRREGPGLQAVGEDDDGAGLAGGQRLLRQGRVVALSGEAGLLPGRVTAAQRASATAGRCPRRSPRPSTTTTCRSPRCSRGTAISRDASTPTSR